MWRSLVFVLMFASLLVATTASAYDRKPVAISNAQLDGSGQTTSSAEKALRGRYPKAKTIRCTGVIVTGHAADSSWLHGTARYWDKLSCIVESSPTAGLSLIYDPKGTKDGFVVYRVKPWHGALSSTSTGNTSTPSKEPPTSTLPSPGSSGGSSGGWLPGSPYFISEDDADSYLEQAFDHAYCTGIPRFGHQGEFPDDEFIMFDCDIEYNGETCDNERLQAVKGSAPGYFRMNEITEGDCY
jgi:hypothetical protein